MDPDGYGRVWTGPDGSGDGSGWVRICPGMGSGIGPGLGPGMSLGMALDGSGWVPDGSGWIRMCFDHLWEYPLSG